MRTEDLPAFFGELASWTEERGEPVERLAYGSHEDQVVELRRGEGGRPLALVLHGGFWRAPYTRRNTAALATALSEAGWASANVEYRRLGRGAYRPMLDDVVAAREALEGFHPVVAVGHSAGGHLALWLAAERAVDAAVALGGVCDLEAAARAGLGEDAVGELLGGTPAEVPEAYLVADPGRRLPLGAPQVLVHGLDDDRVPIEHARAYVARARAAGDDCRLVEVRAGHFEVIDPRASIWPEIVGAAEQAATAAEGTSP